MPAARTGSSEASSIAPTPTPGHRDHLASIRCLMRERGIDHCISVAPESLFYYGGHDSWVSVNSPQAVIFSAADGDADHMLRETDIALARESSWIADVRAYRLMFDDIPGIMAAVAREQGLADGRVAIETQSYALPFALGTVLARALEPARIVDATELTGIPRLIMERRGIARLSAAIWFISNSRAWRHVMMQQRSIRWRSAIQARARGRSMKQAVRR